MKCLRAASFIIALGYLSTTIGAAVAQSSAFEKSEVDYAMLRILDVNTLQKRAASGEAAAQCALGERYLDGNGVQQDPAEAFLWFQRAAAQHFVKAELQLASAYQVGLGTHSDPNQSINWFRKASAEGSPDGQYFLAFELWNVSLYYDRPQALVLFRKAADQGYSLAERELGKIYETGGSGLPKDKVAARYWLEKAAEQNDPAARAEVTKLDAESLASTDLGAASSQDSRSQELDSERQEIADKIENLRSDIESREQDAQNNENNANQVLNNCSGPGAALCQALGQAGAARMRQKAAQDRNQAGADREEIQRLEGQQVEAGQRRDASYGGNLAQVTQQSPTIQETAAQQQANLQAMAATKQQQQEQARLATQQNSRVVQTTTASQQSSSPQQTVSAQSSCTNMTGSVQGSVTVGSDGWVSGHFTNNSVQTLYVFYTFKKMVCHRT